MGQSRNLKKAVMQIARCMRYRMTRGPASAVNLPRRACARLTLGPMQDASWRAPAMPGR